MTTSDQTHAILLLTTHLGRAGPTTPKPLGPAEWGRFAQWLGDHGLAPEVLLAPDAATLLSDCSDASVASERILQLLGRGSSLGLALERWERAGLWVLPRSDPDYPARLKSLLRTQSPPLLFGCGQRQLLNSPGVAVIGSRDATPEDLELATRLGAQAASEGLCIVSGAARGVDEAAMLGALAAGGTAVGVLADGLFRAVTSSKYRQHLGAGSLALVSPFNPDAGFDVGSAMSRNRYIYCLSSAAVVASVRREVGGTWSGAVENLKRAWVPLWVRRSDDPRSGSSALVAQGARWLPEPVAPLATLLSAGTTEVPSGAASDLLFAADTQSSSVPVLVQASFLADATPGYESVTFAHRPDAPPCALTRDLDCYDLFLLRLKRLCCSSPATLAELQKALGLPRVQLKEWLDRAERESRLARTGTPARYTWIAPVQR